MRVQLAVNYYRQTGAYIPGFVKGGFEPKVK